MKKKLIVVMGLIMSFALAACGSSNGDDNGSNGNTDSGNGTGTVQSNAKEITMWGSWAGEQIDQLNELISIYNDSQDEYKVTYVVQQNVEDQLLISIAGGELPDLILWDRYNTSTYASRGVLQPLNELVERDSVNMDDFYSEAAREMTYDDELFGIPLLVDTRVLFYNKDLMEGLTVPTTWDEMIEVAPKATIRDGDRLTQAGFSLQDSGLFNMYMLQASGELVNENDMSVNFNNTSGKNVLEFWDTLLNDKKVYDLGFDSDSTQFAAGNLAMTYNGPWALGDFGKIEGLNFGVSLPLAGANGDTASIMGGFGLVMPNNGKNQEGAWDFIKWWTTQPENGVEFAKISGWLPANLIAADDEFFANHEFYSVFVEAMKNAIIRPTTEGYSNFESLILIPQLQNWMSGTISADEALKTIDEQGTTMLRENNQ